MARLDLIGLRKRFGAVEVLHGIDIALPDGGFLVLLGPSGCGKSTLLAIIAGLEEATTGEVRIGGKSVNGKHPKDRNIAMVFQSYALYPTMDVARNIGFGLEMRGTAASERAEKVAASGALLQIGHLMDRRPADLSGGQRQRVAMGRAIVRDPDLFLFDEPLSNLDAKLRVEMRTEIKRLHNRLGTTIVYVTHDQVEAMTLGTLVAVMKDGVIQQLAPPRVIYDHPANLFVAGFIGSPAMNLIPARATSTALELSGGSRLPLPTDLTEGQEVIAGIRPEQLALDPAGPINAVVDVIELTGADTMTSLRMGEAQVTARLSPRFTGRPGDSVSLSVETAMLCLFDPKTGQNLRPAP